MNESSYQCCYFCKGCEWLGGEKPSADSLKRRQEIRGEMNELVEQRKRAINLDYPMR